MHLEPELPCCIQNGCMHSPKAGSKCRVRVRAPQTLWRSPSCRLAPAPIRTAESFSTAAST